jgi:3-dehydroquinate dehydratase I
MHNARVCTVVIDADSAILHYAEKFTNFFEIRIDLIGEKWEKVATELHRPWIATNRDVKHGGKWQGHEKDRILQLIKASSLGADTIDIEIDTNDLNNIIPVVKSRSKCLISFHDWQSTPPLDVLAKIVQRQLDAGADICKVVTTARKMDDNVTILKLIKKFPWASVIAFAMGPEGIPSRILSPLAGGYLTYAALQEEKESAPGQITLDNIHSIYRMIADEKP